MSSHERNANAGLAALLVLQGIMLGSLYAGITPHPPATTPLFGIGPFLGASLAAAAAALCLGPSTTTAGRILAGAAALMALVSFGPQKYFDAQFTLIWPAVLSGQIAAVSVIASIFRRAGQHGSSEASDVA